MKNEVYVLHLRDYPGVYVAYHDNEFHISQTETLKYFGLNPADEAVRKIIIGGIRVEFRKDDKVTKPNFIHYKQFEQLFQIHNSQRGLVFYSQVMKHKTEKENNFDGLTINDLHTDEQKEKFIEERNAVAARILSLEAKSRENAPYVQIVKSLYGANVKQVNFTNINDELKYDKRIPLTVICQDLRLAGIFDENNLPKKKFIDDHAFKIITLSEGVLTKTKIYRSVIALQKGIHLIEAIIDKKYGGQKK